MPEVPAVIEPEVAALIDGPRRTVSVWLAARFRAVKWSGLSATANARCGVSIQARVSLRPRGELQVRESVLP
jgi:hypothetical protein